MPAFQGLPLAILTAVSAAGGDSYSPVEESDVRAGLASMEIDDPDKPTFDNLMFALKDSGHLDWYRSASSGFINIRLLDRGRQEVQGWPVPGQLSRDDFDALLGALEGLANDPEVDKADRDQAQKMLDAGRGLSVDLAVAIVGAWLSARMGIG